MLVEGVLGVHIQTPVALTLEAFNADEVNASFISKNPSASIQVSNWQKISRLIVCYFYVVRSFEKEVFLEYSRILSCLVRLKSVLFNLLCVFDLRLNA